MKTLLLTLLSVPILLSLAPGCRDKDGGDTSGESDADADADTDADTDTDPPDEDADGDGFTPSQGDCDDGDEDAYPGAPELAGDGADNDCDGATDEVSAAELANGDLVISEIMVDPAAADDANGQWFEIHNASGSTVDLGGVIVSKEDGTAAFTIEAGAFVEDGGWFVLGSSSDSSENGGYVPDYAYTGFTLSTTDSIVLGTDGKTLDTVLDAVSFTADDFPVSAGASMILSDMEADGALGESWCLSTSSYGDGDLGTPGAANDECAGLADEDEDGYPASEDCDDADEDVNPGADEIWYDGIDQDCAEDDDFDADADTHHPLDHGGSDCDDTDPDAYAGAPDTWYDGVDSDCAGDDDYDADIDGFQSAAIGGLDCDDADAGVNPSAADTWYDGVDSDCSGGSDYDMDEDGYDGAAWGGGDCDDADASFNPGAAEIWYDGTDQDCDGASDYDADSDGHDSDAHGGSDCDDAAAGTYPGAADAWYDGIDADCAEDNDYDADVDGFESEAFSGDDCNDSSAAINPDATEVWYDGVDADCEGDDDYDRDGDGYRSSAHGGTDCNDANAAINPGEAEIWYDGVDQDCGLDNDYDADSDGYDAEDHGGDDCDDTVPSINPGEAEVWYNGIDQDCDGGSDYDQDGDGYDAEDYGDDDCDDTDEDINPEETEVRGDGIDNDCDGVDLPAYPTPADLGPGDLIITEYQKNPAKVDDSLGEWFEVYNNSGMDVSLLGLYVYDESATVEDFTVTAELVVAAGDYVVFGKNDNPATNGGVAVDYEWSGFTLGNGEDEIYLTYDGVIFDQLLFTDLPGFPDKSGYSATLDPDATDAADNDDGGNWCDATSSYGTGDFGTPGAANDECP